MRSSTLLLAALALAFAPPLFAQDFRPGGPTDGGTRATVDLPKEQHIRNVGGSDGAGLCVFTSAEVVGRWQSVPQLDGFQRWMTQRPGGGWPEKLEEMLTRYCREKGASIPNFIQHTGGDEEFLDLAIRTGRAPCITYAGEDDFYKDRFGRPAKIAHMVVCGHLDPATAPNPQGCILDNNREGKWIWMSRRDLLKRWRDMNGGWAVVFLDSPPPPHPAAARQAFGQCYPGQPCQQPVYVPTANGYRLVYPVAPTTPAPVIVDPTPTAVPAPDPPQPAVAEPPKPENFGIDSAKIHAGKKWFLNGAEVTKGEALDAFKLSDDSDRWHLVCVGPADLVGRFKAATDALDAATRAKLHVSAYAPGHWAVGLFALPAGVSLRKPAVNRVGAEAGRITGEITPDTLKRFVADGMNPPKPMPAPAPAPAPEPQPQPAPEPAAPSNPFGLPMWALAAIAAALTYFFTRRKS